MWLQCCNELQTDARLCIVPARCSREPDLNSQVIGNIYENSELLK